LLLSRIIIGGVLLINLQAAVEFIIYPKIYTPMFELGGSEGIAAIKGFGVMFLMWNVPYLIAFFHPQKYKVSLFEATAMQLIGVIGETMIRSGLPTTNLLLRKSIFRFAIFDGVGLIALVLAIILSQIKKDEAI
jgi:hypothetical protein